MAISEGSETLTVTKEERTHQAIIVSHKNQDGLIIVFREANTYADDGSTVARQDRPQIQRKASQILSEKVSLADGTTISASQIMEALPLFFDQWRAEDQANPPVN